jgi:hypothetical protein
MMVLSIFPLICVFYTLEISFRITETGRDKITEQRTKCISARGRGNGKKMREGLGKQLIM